MRRSPGAPSAFLRHSALLHFVADLLRALLGAFGCVLGSRFYCMAGFLSNALRAMSRLFCGAFGAFCGGLRRTSSGVRGLVSGFLGTLRGGLRCTGSGLCSFVGGFLRSIGGFGCGLLGRVRGIFRRLRCVGSRILAPKANAEYET